MSRRNRARRPSGAQLNKAVAIKPAATFTVQQIQALASAGLVGPSVPATEALPRDPRWATVPFAPGTPLFPQGINVPQPGQRQAEPRQFEIPVSWNLPGFSDRLIPWAILRNAADIPLFRQCIETRKAEAVTKPWDIRLSKNAIRRAQQADPTANLNDVKKALQAKVDPHIGRLIDFWSEPDRWNGRDFTAWATLALEEILVLDALPIFPRRTKGGDLYGFEIIDGTTIKPLLDDFGRRPLPPNPAFQQILYGFPRGEYVSDVDLDPEVQGQQPDPGAYTADQLIYHVTHGRTFTPYGHSAVERALQDGDLWMRRHGWLKAEYTDGVMPSGWLEAGEGQAEWTPQQLEVFEKAFNDYYAGATPSRQRFRILPWGMTPSKSEDLGEKYKPDYDLFLLKLVVRHFDTNINELGFSEARGLGSAGMHESQERNQERTATQPTLDRLGKLCTRLQVRFLDAPPELEFVFPGDEAEDEEKEDQIWNQRVATGRATRNEDRDRQGMPRFEFPEADMPAVETGTGLLFVEGSSAAVAPGQVFTGGQPPGLGLPGEPPPGAPGGGGPGVPPPTGGPAGGPGSVPPKPPTPPAGGGGGGNGAAGGLAGPVGGLTKADLDWLDGQLALTRPGATGLELAQHVLDKLRPTELGKMELVRHAKWRRNLAAGRVRSGQFTFEHLTRQQALSAGIEVTANDPNGVHRYAFKADDQPTEPAPPNREWPGWQVDLAAAAAGGTALLAVLGSSGIAAAITGALVARAGHNQTPAGQIEVQHLLDELGVRDKIVAAIAPVIKNIQTGGYLIGSASAVNMVHGDPMPDWTPGDWGAAVRLLTESEGGTGPGLRAMLAQADITIKSIADTQVEALARILANGLAAHETPAQIARTVQTLGVTPDRARMIAHTELSRAMGQAALDRYEEMGVPGTEWLRAPDDRVCPTCAKNAAHGPVPLGENYPSGHPFPPAHPNCRCVPAPVLLDMAKADAVVGGTGEFDESKHPRAAGGKFGPGGGGDDPTAGGPPTPPPVTVADIHNAAQQQTTVGGDTTDSDHPAAKLTAGAAAKQRMAEQMKQRNELMRQRLSQAQARQAAAELRRAQAQAKKDAAAAAAAKKKAAKGAKASALSDAASQAEQILRHLDALAAGKTDGELPELIKAEYPDLTAGQIALLIKAWDPALHPRDPLTGKFVSVGVRRPAFKPGTRKRWGRSKEEIKAWEYAHAHGEGTRFVDAGRAGARGVGHAPVGKFHRALDAQDFHAVGQRNVQENMLVGRNRQELVVLADQLGMDGEALPRQVHNAKQKILDHEQARRDHENLQAAAQRAVRAAAERERRAKEAADVAAHQPLHAPRALEGFAEFNQHHRVLDVARGNRAQMHNVLHNLQKQQIVDLAKQRRLQIDGVKAKRDDLVAQFMHEEAYKYALEDGLAAGMGRAQAVDEAHRQAQAVVAGERQVQQMANDLKVQRKLRREAQRNRRLPGSMDEFERAQRDRARQIAEIEAERAAPVNQREAARQALRDRLAQERRDLENAMGGGDRARLLAEGQAAADAAREREQALARGDAHPDLIQGPGDAYAHIQAQQAKLAEHINAGIVDERKPDVRGAIGITSIRTHADGSRTVHKIAGNERGMTGVEQAHAEELAAHLALHMGINAPVVQQDKSDSGGGTVDMQMLEGYEVAGRVFSSSQMERIAASPLGRRVGLFDFMIGQIDRHQNNWMARSGGPKIDYDNPKVQDIAMIDHGFTFPIARVYREGGRVNEDQVKRIGLNGAGSFKDSIGNYGAFNPSNDFKLEEIDNARTALERMKPEFDRLGRMDWYNLAAARLGEVAKRSTDARVKELSLVGR